MFGNFWYFGTDGTVCEDKEFGTSEVVSQDPLEVKYTIADNAKWSDGTPITINDYLLDWAAQNPEFLVPGLASGQNKDAEAVFNHVSTTFSEHVPEGRRARRAPRRSPSSSRGSTRTTRQFCPVPFRRTSWPSSPGWTGCLAKAT